LIGGAPFSAVVSLQMEFKDLNLLEFKDSNLLKFKDLNLL
jgi:hypothetical protein